MIRKVLLFQVLLIAAALAATVVVYPHIPAQIPFHWNFHMEPDLYGPRWALYLFGPGFMTATMLLTWLLPWLSPQRFQVSSFRSTFRLVMLMMFSMMAYMDAVMLWADSGRPMHAGRAILGGVFLFMALFGNVMGKLRRNFFIGVRTPWTLASERVWNATHRFAARIWMAAGLLGLVLSLAGLYVLALFALLATALASVVYSLVLYKQLERRGEL